MKLHVKIALIFSLCISLVFALFLTTIQGKMKEFETQQVENFNEQLIQSRSSEIGSWIYQRVCELRMIAQSDLLQEKENWNSDELNAYLERLNDKVQNLFGSTSQTYLIVNSSGIGWTQEGIRFDISEREYFLEASAVDATVEFTLSKPLISKIDGQRTVFICYPIWNGDEKIAYLLGSITVGRLDDILSGIQIFEGTTWIMDRYGRVIAEDANHSDDFELCPNNLSLNKVSDQLQKSNFTLMGFELNPGQGQLMAAVIPYTDGWRLCALAKESVIYQSLVALQSSILAIWGVLLIGAVLFSIVFARSITRPIHRLQTAMKEVADGNLEVSYIPGKGKDEVATLGRGFLAMVTQIRTLMQRMVEEQKAKRQAELNVLQTQINPHFLYNTLDTIQWKALEHDAVEVADIINSLSSFFRISLSKGQEIITLNQEVEHVYHYLFIQQVRYRSILDFDLRLAKELEDYPIIKLLIQPLVENAIYHGIKPANRKGKIMVDITHDEHRIHIVVADDGVGMALEKLHHLQENLSDPLHHQGYGLFNVAERIRLTYGDQAKVEIESELQKGCKIHLMIPYEEDKL